MWRLLVSFVLAMTLPGVGQTPGVPDRDWKQWLEDVKPLMAVAERSEAKNVPAEGRDAYREAFWARRNATGQQADNPQRAEFEQRVKSAEKRFRDGKNGPWNDCGQLFVLLGTPDRVEFRTPRLSDSDPMQAMREQDDVEFEAWVYLRPARLPAAQQGYLLRFTRKCESLNGPGFQRLLAAAAASYLVAR